MLESITAVAWAFSTVSAIANSEPGKKFIEGIIGTVAEKITGAGLTKVEQLRKAIVEKLQSNPAAVEAVAKVEAFGTEDDLRDVAAHLDMVTRKDPTFAQQVQSLLQEIHQTIVQVDDDSTMTQKNYGGTNYQTKTGPYNTNFLGGEHHHH
jgi:hypothetical protein